MSNLEFFFSYYLGRKLDPSDPPYVYVALTTLDSDNGAFFPSNAVHGTKRMGWIDGGAYFHSEERDGEIGDEDLLTEEEIKKLLVEMGLNLNDAYVKLAREHEAEDGFGEPLVIMKNPPDIAAYRKAWLTVLNQENDV